MRIHPFFLALFSFCNLSAQEANINDAISKLLVEHKKLESYFAVYKGTAPNGKSLNATIVYHGEGKLAAMKAQFMLNGEVAIVPFQATTPELGMVFFDEELLHLHDASTLLTQLTDISATLYNDNQNPLGNWTPALALTSDTAAIRLGISSVAKLPWILDELPEGTTHKVEGESVSFATPEGANYLVDVKTGILNEQRFPNAEGERTLILEEKQLNLSEAEIEAFIKELIPAETKRMSLREHPLFEQVQLQVLTQLVARVDQGKTTPKELESRLDSAKLASYLQTAYPDAAQIVATKEEWAQALQETSGQPDQAEQLTMKMAKIWGGEENLQPSRLLAETEAGKKAAELLTTTLKNTFLKIAIEQALK